MTRIEELRMKKLRAMLEWRQRPEANGHQHAEAESLTWAISVIEECYKAVEGYTCTSY